MPDIAKTSNSYESETDGRRDAAQWNRDRPYPEQVENKTVDVEFRVSKTQNQLKATLLRETLPNKLLLKLRI